MYDLINLVETKRNKQIYANLKNLILGTFFVKNFSFCLH